MRTGLVAIVLLMACKDRAAPLADERGKPQDGCIADRLVDLRLDWPEVDGCDADDVACRDACLSGDAAACFQRALSVQIEKKDEEQSLLLFLRACERGHASGCTNYAAALWATSESGPTQICATRIFEKTCAAKDHFGCGMFGRVILDAATEPGEVARGRAILVRGCDELGGFACRALAKHIESGQLGPADPGRVKTLLRRACDTGDQDACGDHETADETFKSP